MIESGKVLTLLLLVMFYFCLYLTVTKFTMCLKCCSSARWTEWGRSKVRSYQTGSGKTGRKEGRKVTQSLLGKKVTCNFFGI